MPATEDELEYDEDSPPLDASFFTNGTFRINGRILPSRASPTDPHDPELLAFMNSRAPLVQMDPEILGGMPVFKDTLVPIKRMFDYLLAEKTMDEFLEDSPTVSRKTAIAVLENDATLFYEHISKAIDSAYEAISIAIDSAAMPSSRPK